MLWKITNEAVEVIWGSQGGILEQLNYFMTTVITERASLRNAICQFLNLLQWNNLKAGKTYFGSQFQRSQPDQCSPLHGAWDEMAGRQRQAWWGQEIVYQGTHPQWSTTFIGHTFQYLPNWCRWLRTKVSTYKAVGSFHAVHMEYICSGNANCNKSNGRRYWEEKTILEDILFYGAFKFCRLKGIAVLM